MIRSRTISLGSLGVLFLVASGCASGPQLAQSRMAASQPMLSVERFLQAANTGDLEAMARIFGTSRGPIADQAGGTLPCAFRRMGSWVGLGSRCVSWMDIEIRMDAIARLLRHDDYRVRSESSVAGRARPTIRVGVDMARGASSIQDVPFVVVQASDGRWMVEEIGLERLTAEAESDGLRVSWNWPDSRVVRRGLLGNSGGSSGVDSTGVWNRESLNFPGTPDPIPDGEQVLSPETGIIQGE